MIREVAFRRDTEAPKQERKCSSREANFLCVLEEGIVMARIEQKRQILSRDVDGKGVSMLRDNQETETTALDSGESGGTHCFHAVVNEVHGLTASKAEECALMRSPQKHKRSINRCNRCDTHELTRNGRKPVTRGGALMKLLYIITHM